MPSPSSSHAFPSLSLPEAPSRRSGSWARLGAWAAFLGIGVATLAPVRLRPRLTSNPQDERSLAFGLVGFLLARGYPNAPFAVMGSLVTAAFGLEAAQLATPDRHGRLRDAIAKSSGALAGVALARLVDLGTRPRR